MTRRQIKFETPRPTLAILAAAALAILAACGEKKVVDTRAVLSIKTNPEDATVVVDGQSIGQSPLKLKVPKGQHLVEARKNDFKSAFQSIVCVNTEHEMNLELEPVTASVMIKSYPDKAAVLIDGRQIGETPLFLHHQKIGQHQAILKKTGYADRQITWEVTGPRPQMVEENISSILGSLKITSEPGGCELFVDGQRRGVTPFDDKIEEGTHSVRLTLPGHTVFEKNDVKVLREKETAVHGVLTIIPGKAEITSAPKGAQITLLTPAGEEIDKGTAPVTIENLQPGTYQIRAEMPPDHDPETKSFEIFPDQTTSVAVKLFGNTGGIDFVASPAGVSVYLDGKFIGSSELDEDGESVKVISVRDVAAGVHELMVSHKNAEPERVTMPIKVSKREILRPTPVQLWVKDTKIVLKDGSEYVGRLHRENPREISIELKVPNEDGKIRQTFSRREIKEMTTLEDDY